MSGLVKFLILIIGIVTTIGGASAMKEAGLKEKLTGTWTLVSAEDFVDGQWTTPFGNAPRGYFSFGNDGQVSVQFMKYPIAPEGERSSDDYLAYFGSYIVDEKESTFTSTVRGALDIALLGTEQKRSFKFKDDQLIVGDLVTYRRFFKKIPIIQK